MDVKTVNGGYTFTLPGILKLVTALLAFVNMIIIAAALNTEYAEYGYLLFVSIFVWQMCLLLYARHVYDINGKNMDIFEAVALSFCIVFGAIAFIMSAVYASPGGRGSNKKALIAITVRSAFYWPYKVSVSTRYLRRI
ncbi:unnamed protein product [Dibothriocephalus latus]|uniref:MARVEL domain-containing protein n=1 Tax=Dibothriocephalus latus TaxID=60516 RepID=A0A3P6QMP0_DIBLA|nr:unnamed protein product [Dibothriocephalus latus]